MDAMWLLAVARIGSDTGDDCYLCSDCILQGVREARLESLFLGMMPQFKVAGCDS
jgi:hypothetical protein